MLVEAEVVTGGRRWIWEEQRREFHSEIKAYKNTLVFYSDKAKARNQWLQSPFKLTVL